MIRLLVKRVLLVCLLGLMPTGCGDGGGGGGGGGGGTGGTGGTGHSTTGKSWTVLVYMVADNNLEQFGLLDLQEMANTGATSDLHFVVQMDRSTGYTSDVVPGVGDWSGVKRLVLQPGGGFQDVQDLPDPDMGSASTLSDFIAWGVKNYPADRYAIVLWDHGGAWPGFGDDESHSGDTLSLAELKQGFQQGLAAANLKSFAVIGFDACLMGTYEVAKGLAPYGEYLVASEQLEPGTGWDYNSFRVVRDDPTKDGAALGRAIIDGFKTQSTQGGDGADITLSLTDLLALDDLTASVDALAAAGNAQLATGANVIGRERADALKFGEFADPEQSFNMVDLGDLVTKLAAVDSTHYADAKAKVSAALAKAVLYKTSGSATTSATGLSIYFPPAARYYTASYDTLAEVANWRAFLKAYHGSGASSGDVPAFVNADHLADASFDSTGHFLVTGDLGDASSVASATFTYGFQDSSGNVILLGDSPADVTGNTVTGSWNLSVLTLSQVTSSNTTNVGYGYLSIDVANDNNTFSVSIPFQYAESGLTRFAIRQLVFDANGNLLQDTYYAELNGAFGELEAAPGATLMPLVQVVDASTGNTSWAAGGTVPFSASDLINNPISLDFRTIVSGKTVFGMLSVENFGGNGDYVYTTAVTP